MLARGMQYGLASLAALTFGIFAAKEFLNEELRTTCSAFKDNGFSLTVHGTCATLHASVAVHNGCFASIDDKDCMGTYRRTHAAAIALGGIELKSYDIFEVLHQRSIIADNRQTLKEYRSILDKEIT